jgi:hypothetical protein
MTTPRTIAGQAALSGTRPYMKRALGRTILRIETEALTPYREALAQADRLLEEIAAMDATSAWETPARADLVVRARAAHESVGPLLAQPLPDEPD